ncbi:uridine 5 -monophosphate synthase-like [Brachionus plicatilis]|uniref:Uridine 5-monophosphate synthase-like n=1 Tax=Brachionus plicatilis TaxID=10195 RepID=A0A3M7SIC5_BRAPC|nr:uridine 5 -monophosphate synthase-like [Brachionus plicatilis]
MDRTELESFMDNLYEIGCVKFGEFYLSVYKAGDSCLLIEDVVVYGTSILETSEALKMYDLNVTEAITLMDREQGGYQNIKDNNINFLSVIKAKGKLIKIKWTKLRIFYILIHSKLLKTFKDLREKNYDFFLFIDLMNTRSQIFV